jgi:hypothetical protein
MLLGLEVEQRYQVALDALEEANLSPTEVVSWLRRTPLIELRRR